MTDKFATHRLTGAATATLTASIKRRAATLSKDIHAACVAVMLQAATHDLGGHLDASKALPLVQALGEAMPRNKVILWFATFTNIRVTTTKGKDGKLAWGCKVLGPKDEDYLPQDAGILQDAIDTPYWVLSPEPAMPDIDIAALLASTLKKALKAQTDGKLKANPKNDALIAGLRKLVPTDAA